MAVIQKRERLDPEMEKIARADLKQLGDIRIDDVLSFIDRGIENMPSYMDLYRRWESQQWSVGDLDFTLDREDWLKSTELEKKSTLWSHRLFFNGEERVTSTLAPFVWAAPTPEIEIFLSTQMVDEARHTVFFQRWWQEVVGTESKSLGELLAEIKPDTNEGYNTLFYDRLPSTAQRLASNPKDFDAFIEGVTIYHIIVEATIALTLLLQKRIKHNEAKLRRGEWAQRDDRGEFLFGKTVGLVGLGRVGSHVARRLVNWDVRLLAADPYVSEERARALGTPKPLVYVLGSGEAAETPIISTMADFTTSRAFRASGCTRS